MEITPLLLLLFASFCGCSKILVIFPWQLNSHHKIGLTLCQELTKRNHSIYFATPFSTNQDNANLKELLLPKHPEFQVKLQKESSLNQLISLSNYGLNLTKFYLNSSPLKDLFEGPDKFDAVILDHFHNDGFMVFGTVFNCPVILIAGHLSVLNLHYFGNPANLANVPNILTDLTTMDFWQRIYNIYEHSIQTAYLQLIYFPQVNLMLKNIQSQFGGMELIQKYLSFLLVVNDQRTSNNGVIMPNVKFIPGHFIKDNLTVPNFIGRYFDEAPNGVIFISIEPIVKNNPEIIQELMKILQDVPLKIIWTSNEKITGKPENVLISKWLPQQAILAHPKTKLFITTGDLVSTTEAIFSGVPILGIPTFWDENQNILQGVKHGYALKLDYEKLTPKTFQNAIFKMLKNTNYQENARNFSKQIRDRQIEPSKELTYWIEYVIRHKGAEHLKTSALRLSWYQLHLIDVLSLLVLALIVLLWIFLKVLRKLLKSKKSLQFSAKKLQ